MKDESDRCPAATRFNEFEDGRRRIHSVVV
jgi:hypothetical protein